MRRTRIARKAPPGGRCAASGARDALGIIIGIGAVIAMMEVGEGSRKAVEQSIASMGANTILVVAPIVRTRTQVVYGDRNWVPVFIYGTTPDFLRARDWEQLADGVRFTDRDVRNGSTVCLIGQTIVPPRDIDASHARPARAASHPTRPGRRLQRP